MRARFRLAGGGLRPRGGSPSARGGRSLRSRPGSAGGFRRSGALLIAGLLLLQVLIAPRGLIGQEPVAPVADTVSFAEAVRVALENNPAYLRGVNGVEAAEHGERQSVGALLPSVNASVGFNGFTSRNKTAFDELGRPLEEADFVENTRSSASQGLSGGVQLFNLQTVRSLGAARAQTDAAEARVDLQAAQLRTQVGAAYYDVVRREQLVDVERRTLRTAREQLAAINELLRVAAKQPTDVLGAELDVARAEQGLQQAEGEARKAHLALRQGMGVAMDVPFDVARSFPAVADPASLDVSTLVERALRESPRVEEQHATVAAAESSLSAARAARYPTLSGNYGYSRSTNAGEYAAIGALDLPNSGWNFGISVSVPLFNRFQTSAAIGRARVDAENARESLREARLALEQEVRAALIDLENAHASVRLAERSAEIARERLRQGQEQYRVGTLQDYTALQQMIEAVAQQERAVTNAYYNFTLALLTLEEKVGGPVEVGG